MKVFESDENLNFVDENNVVLGFSYYQCCCEHFGWLLSRDVPQGEQVLERLDGDMFDLSDYVFDRDFFQESYTDDEYGSFATFRIVNKKGEILYITLFNHHDGYYSHGFSFEHNGLNIRTGNL